MGEPRGLGERLGEPMSGWTWILLSLAAVAAAVLAASYLTIFVVQPIGAVPEGRTLIVWRGAKMRLVDSADAICAREASGVSLLCRGAVLAAIARDEDQILLRLPYVETLYLWSTGGASYDG